MTYKELAFLLNCIPKERLEDDVTAHLGWCDEFVKVSLFTNKETDVLDKGHYYLELPF